MESQHSHPAVPLSEWTNVGDVKLTVVAAGSTVAAAAATVATHVAARRSVTRTASTTARSVEARLRLAVLYQVSQNLEVVKRRQFLPLGRKPDDP